MKAKIELSLVLVILFFSVFFAFLSASSQELSIGFPQPDQNINLVEDEHPFAQMSVNASAQPILRLAPEKRSGVQLFLADSFTIGLNNKSIELRIRQGLSFSNSKLLSMLDIQASLQRCENKPKESLKKILTVFPKYKIEQRLDRIYIILESEAGLDSIYAFLQSCPILEQRSIRLFAKDLGSANLILGTGPYQLTSRLKNREVRLERVSKSNAWASAINLRSFLEASHALTALRTGTIDAFYTNDAEVYAKAASDPTLLSIQCGVYNIILRKGLEIACFSLQQPGAIKYSSQ